MRTFIKGAALSLSLALAAGGASAKELKLSHFMSPEHPFHGMIFEWWADELLTASDGDLTIEIYPAGELGPGPVEQYSRAIDGVSDISFVVQGYTPGNPFPLTSLAEQPGAIQDVADTTGAMNRAGDLFADEYRRVHLLSTWAMPPAVLFTRNTPVQSITDVKGMKVRVGTKDAGKLVEAWGGTPIFMPATEVYTAMQTGVVDAVLMNASGAVAFKLTEVSEYMVSGFDSLPAVFAIVMNRDVYSGLSDAQKSALDSVSSDFLNAHAGDVSNKISIGSTQQFVQADGRSHIELTPEQAADFNAAAAQVLETRLKELEDQGLPAREVVAKMRGE